MHYQTCLTGTKTEDVKEFSSINGTMFTAANGTRYFVMEKIRIKVSEHSAESRKPLNSVLEDVIQHAASDFLKK